MQSQLVMFLGGIRHKEWEQKKDEEAEGEDEEEEEKEEEEEQDEKGTYLMTWLVSEYSVMAV